MGISLHSKLELQTFELSKHDQHARKPINHHYCSFKHILTSFCSNSDMTQSQNFISENNYAKSQVFCHTFVSVWRLASQFCLRYLQYILHLLAGWPALFINFVWFASVQDSFFVVESIYLLSFYVVLCIIEKVINFCE